jgi:hypothetical protein
MPTPARRQRSALRKWLTFGPMILPKDWKSAANQNKANRRSIAAKWGLKQLRVTKSGGPAAPGLFKHKTFTSQGSLLVRRGRRIVTVGRKPVKSGWAKWKAKGKGRKTAVKRRR